jgi:hypothetical protein
MNFSRRRPRAPLAAEILAIPKALPSLPLMDSVWKAAQGTLIA